MEGAVLFGIEPSSISIRRAKYTIGARMNDYWNEEKHSEKGKKYFNEDTKSWFCEDCFIKFIEINQELKYEEEISRIHYMSEKNQRYIYLEFYKTKK